MLRRLSLAALLAATACAHAPARTEGPPGAAQPAGAGEGAAAPAVGQAPAERRALGPIHTLELRLVKTFPDAIAPKAVALSPDGRWAAVMNLEGMEAWLIDTRTLELDRHIDFAPFKEPAEGWNYSTQKPIFSYAQKPVEATFTPDSRWLWFSFHNGACVVAYDLTEQEVTPASASSYRAVIRDRAGSNRVWRLPMVPTGKTPKVVEATPDGKYLVVGNWHSGSITVIDAARKTIAATIQSGASPAFIPRGLAITPDSRKVYVAHMRGGTVSAIDLGTMRRVWEKTITPSPRHLALSRDGRVLYLSENKGGQVLKYDLQAEQVIGSSAVGSQTRTIALSHDERVLYAVSNEDGKIVALRADDLTHLFDAPYTAPMGVAISPDDTRVWITSYTDEGYVSVFDVVIDGQGPPQARNAAAAAPALN